MGYSAEDLFKIRFNLDAFEKGGRRMIGGFISSSREDKQGETVLQRGLDMTYFAKNGFFNDNHDKSAGGVIGFPRVVDFRLNPAVGHKCWYSEGELLKTDTADRIWAVAQQLKDSGRSLGFSVEGKVLARHPNDKKQIIKARVSHVAVTQSPVNTDTRLEVLSKSLSSLFDQDELDSMNKALATGTGTDSAGMEGGRALETQDLEEDEKDIHVPGDENEEDAKKGESASPLTLGRVFDKVVESRPGIAESTAFQLARMVFQKLHDGE